MTIAAAYLVSEGVVLGADSTTTISVPTPQGREVAQLLNHAQKVFEIGESSRFGICTWGDGGINATSHRTIIARLSEKINERTTLQQAGEELVKIVEPLIKSSQNEFVGYYLGGWDPVDHNPGCIKFEFTKKAPPTIEPLQNGQCIFSGMPNFFSRVFFGFDPQLPQNLVKEIKAGLPEGEIKNNFDKIFQPAFEKAYQPLIARGYPDLPIREAMDFVYSYLHLTIKAMKFMFGAPGCGGPIEIAFISTDRKFRWAEHKAFTSAIQEQKGGEDVG